MQFISSTCSITWLNLNKYRIQSFVKACFEKTSASIHGQNIQNVIFCFKDSDNYNFDLNIKERLKVASSNPDKIIELFQFT
jgi:hypothetical protein